MVINCLYISSKASFKVNRKSLYKEGSLLEPQHAIATFYYRVEAFTHLVVAIGLVNYREIVATGEHTWIKVVERTENPACYPLTIEPVNEWFYLMELEWKYKEINEAESNREGV